MSIHETRSSARLLCSAVSFTLVAVLGCAAAEVKAAAAANNSRPTVCNNVELRKTIQIIDRACNDISCDFRELKEIDSKVDKPALLAAMTNPYMKHITLFFPEDKSDLGEIFDWKASKKSYLDSFRYVDDPDNAIVFVLGRASSKGNFQHNVDLSRERMRSVLNYLKQNMSCKTFHGAWLGKGIFQLVEDDARRLGIAPVEYRNNPLILNQSVHVFVFPCGDLIKN
jgi:outer membrane protein OmpA-like peptidoglycan-associated protein